MQRKTASGSPLATKSLVRAYRQGKFQEVEDAIDAAGPSLALSPEVINLRTRLYIKNDPPAGLEFIARRTRLLRGSALAEATMLTGVLHARALDDRMARSSFDRAEKLMKSQRGGALLDELRYHCAFLHWTAERVDEAESLLPPLRSSKSADVRVRAKILESLIANARGRYREQAALSFDALLLALENDDVELQAYAEANLATLARELPMPQLREAVRASVERIAWTSDLRQLQFKALKAAGWCCALDGDYFNAFRLLKAASTAAPTAHWRAMAALDRSYLARCLNEPRWAEQELLEADYLARNLDWRGLSDEEHVALVLLAELYADVDAAVALAYLAKFRELGRVVTPRSTFAHDRILGAIADYSAGVVHARLGDVDDARRALTESWDVFDSAHYDWRAGRCALDLYALTGDAVWRERAAEKLAGYPKSWLAARLSETAPASGPIAKLTPAQRRVFDMLVAGKPTEEVASRLGRSIFTVRNHIKAIFLAFDVKTRAALVAEAARQKLVR
jgi:DNA-binding CsgD family transcriptional regulator